MFGGGPVAPGRAHAAVDVAAPELVGREPELGRPRVHLGVVAARHDELGAQAERIVVERGGRGWVIDVRDDPAERHLDLCHTGESAPPTRPAS